MCFPKCFYFLLPIFYCNHCNHVDNKGHFIATITTTITATQCNLFPFFLAHLFIVSAEKVSEPIVKRSEDANAQLIAHLMLPQSGGGLLVVLDGLALLDDLALAPALLQQVVEWDRCGCRCAPNTVGRMSHVYECRKLPHHG